MARSSVRLKLIRPRPIVTGIIRRRIRITCGLRQARLSTMPGSRPRRSGSGITNCTMVATQHADRVGAGAARLEHERNDDHAVPRDRGERRQAEDLVRVQDPRDDAGHAQDRHDREHPARELDDQVRVDVLVARHEERHQPRRDQDEEGREAAEDHGGEPQDDARHAPRLGLLALLAQLHEHRHEGRRDRAVGDQAAHEVRHVERDQERAQGRARAEEARGHDLAHDAGHPRHGGGRPEHRRRRGQTPLLAHRRESLSTRCYAPAAPPAGGRLRVNPKGTGGQLEAAGKARTNRSAAAAREPALPHADQDALPAPLRGRRGGRLRAGRRRPTSAWSPWSTGRRPGARSIATRRRIASRVRPGSSTGRTSPRNQAEQDQGHADGLGKREQGVAAEAGGARGERDHGHAGGHEQRPRIAAAAGRQDRPDQTGRACRPS